MDFEFVDGQKVVHTHRGAGRFEGPAGHRDEVYVCFADDFVGASRVTRDLVYPWPTLVAHLSAYIRRTVARDNPDERTLAGLVADYVGFIVDVMAGEPERSAATARRHELIGFMTSDAARSFGTPEALAAAIIAEFGLDGEGVS